MDLKLITKIEVYALCALFSALVVNALTKLPKDYTI